MRSMVILSLCVLTLGACKNDASNNTPTPTDKTPAATGPVKPDPADTAKKPPKAADLARYTRDIKGTGKLGVTITTELGKFQCELFEDVAPMTVANFVGLGRGLKAWIDPKTRQAMVGKALYPGTIFHRVIPGFMIQGGDPLGTGTGGPGYRFEDETSDDVTFDQPGLLAMANSGPNTNGSQFFITDSTPGHLNGKHTIFGRCDLDTVRAIMGVPLQPSSRGEMSVPVQPITLRHVAIERG